MIFTNYLLRNARLADDSIVDIAIENGITTRIGQDLADQFAETTHEIVDVDRKLVLPGLVDLHTHLREPGFEGSETILSGSRSAAKGGYTAVSAMANTWPVADSAGVVEQVARLGHEAGLCDVFPIGAVTVGLKGEALAELSAMANSAAKVRIFSDDGNCVSDPVLMRRALEYVKSFGGVIAQHAQEPRLTHGSQMNEGAISSKLGLKGWPAIAEESIIARDILTANYLQSRLHICHLTTRGGVELVRWAKSQGMAVTAEVTPHHLILTDELASGFDPIYKVNPPLRTAEDVQALQNGLADGTIDIVATDHAPHPNDSKDCEWSAASFGMVGLETSLSVVVKTMVASGKMGWETLVERMSAAPARIGGYSSHGKILEGAPAHIIIVDTTGEWKVDRELMASKSRNSPFQDYVLPAVVTDTFYNGVRVLKDGELTGAKYE